MCTFKCLNASILSNMWIEVHDMGALGCKDMLHILIINDIYVCILFFFFPLSQMVNLNHIEAL